MAETLNDVLGEILAEQSAETAEPQEAAPQEEEQPVESAPTETPAAEVPAQPTEPDRLAILESQNQQLQGMVQQLLAAQQQAQQQVQEMSNTNEATINSAIVNPPQPNFEELIYMSDEERANAQAEYVKAMAEYTKQNIMKELQPVVDEYQQRMKMAEDERVFSAMCKTPELKGIEENRVGIENIIAKTPELANLPADKRYLLGYLIQKGVSGMNEAPMSSETLVEKVLADPEAMKVLEKRRTIEQGNANKSAPPISASQGQSTAPALSPEQPKTLEEARRQAYKMFGL